MSVAVNLPLLTARITVSGHLTIGYEALRGLKAPQRTCELRLWGRQWDASRM